MPDVPIQDIKFHPFKVYNCDVPSGAPAGTQKWQCWQVRTGIMAVRSEFIIPAFLFDGQYEYFTTVIGGTDGGASGVNAILSSVTPNFPNEFYDFQNDNTVASYWFNDVFPFTLTAPQIVLVGDDPAGYTVTNKMNATCTFILPNEKDAFGVVLAGFWLELTDDPTAGVYGTIHCRTWSADQPSNPLGRAEDPFPNSVTSIPLAQVDPVGGDTFGGDFTNTVATQYLYDHLTNRRVTSTQFSPVCYYRGQTDQDDWDADFSGSVFYPGEQVTIYYHTKTFAGQTITPVALWENAGVQIALDFPTYHDSVSNGFVLMSVGFVPP